MRNAIDHYKQVNGISRQCGTAAESMRPCEDSNCPCCHDISGRILLSNMLLHAPIAEALYWCRAVAMCELVSTISIYRG
jgi:hypothetical protein